MVTGGVRLTVVLQVLQTFTHGLRGDIAVPPPGVADQQEAGLPDAAGAGSDWPPPVHRDRHVAD